MRCASAHRPGTLKNVGWDGSEVVAFRVHFPSRILDHNARDLEKDVPSEIARGNILAWEQKLSDRLDGQPVANLSERVVLAPGMRADLVLFDAGNNVVESWIAGR